ncbi:flagellar basal body rod modification protein FlgD [Aureimonas sp. SA4125]|uniref:flagellar hook assembly protein FlgD n=1 Tax=Aureimonas sp. SA4125 TaxID=2826993 RepID=UPI001CC4F108|nr:flagellar hook assembly protein FlgD [Aureimonas sp. SA4125]BDA85922.1 flagellar basal body rod modification protein FlgD [Aureimonas sp. SA4125]
MSTVDSLSSTTATTATTSTIKTDAKQASLDYDNFLQLLVAQMQNQDPLNPTDPTEQLGQLASFSNVEQGIKTNQKLESMITLSALTQANAAIGHTVTSADGTVSGIVKSVNVTDTGAVATLASGVKLALGAGITIE